MYIFDWQTFWEKHPQEEFAKGNTHWANLRPESYSYQAAFENINASLQFTNTDRVLEVGCGTGELLPLLNTIIPVQQIALSDLSQAMVDIAQAKYPNATVARAAAHLLPFLDEEFTKVFCNGVIQHIASPFFEPTIREMLRVTTIGGKVFIGDVLENAQPEAGVFVYPQEVWKQFSKYAEVEFTESIFEKRLNVVLTKTVSLGNTFDESAQFDWGIGDA